MKKPAIPAIPIDALDKDILNPLKEAVEIITGHRGEKLTLLASTASLDDVIARVNKIIATLQNVT